MPDLCQNYAHDSHMVLFYLSFHGPILPISIITPIAPGKSHDDVIKWKHFPRYCPFVRGIHRSPVNSQHKGQWRGALMFSLICAWINRWVNNGEVGELRRYSAHYDVMVMIRGMTAPFQLYNTGRHSAGRQEQTNMMQSVEITKRSATMEADNTITRLKVQFMCFD